MHGKPSHRDQQQGGVDLGMIVRLNEVTAPGQRAARVHFGSDAVALTFPAGMWSEQANCPIERDPAHDLAVEVMQDRKRHV